MSSQMSWAGFWFSNADMQRTLLDWQMLEETMTGHHQIAIDALNFYIST